MYQTIHEEVSAAGVYQQHRFVLKKILWKKKVLIADQVTLVADSRDGNRKQRYYTIVSGGNVYRLLFDRDSETWWLEEIWVE